MSRSKSRASHFPRPSSAIAADGGLPARKHRLRAYDAVQLAVALDVHRRQEIAGLGPVALVSADRDLNDAAIAEG